MASQVLKKPYECLTCKQQIRISKIDNASAPNSKKKWDKFELDGVTPHVCSKLTKQPEQQEQKEQQLDVSNDLSKEVAAIKAQLLVLASRLDRIEAELQTQVN